MVLWFCDPIGLTPLVLAGDYHQEYYQKNPLRYSFYRFGSGRDRYLEKIWGEDLDVDYSRFSDAARYPKSSKQELRK